MEILTKWKKKESYLLKGLVSKCILY